MTIKQKLEAQWNSPKLGSAVYRVRWALGGEDGQSLVPTKTGRPGTHRGRK